MAEPAAGSACEKANKLAPARGAHGMTRGWVRRGFCFRPEHVSRTTGPPPGVRAREGGSLMTQRETTGATAGLRMSGATAGLGTTAAGAETAISVEGIVKRYGQLTAVNNISFTVRKGETFGLLGPNGAGKTTTLEIIEGLRKPDEGRVVVLGVDVAAEPRRARALMGIQL